MNKWKIILVCILSALQLSAFAANKGKKNKTDEPKRVYMYGVSIDFNDSTVYVTDVQYLDSIVVAPDGSIPNHYNYSLQMKVYTEGTLGEYNQTCAIVYSDKKKNLEKRFLKTIKKYQTDESKILKRIGTDAFKFHK